MAGGDVQKFLGGLWALASYLMNQGLVGHLGQEGSYHVGVGDIRELVTLPGHVPDVPMEGLTSLLTVVLEVPWVLRVLIHALEVSQKDLFQIRPTLDYVGQQVFQLCLCRIGQE